MRSLQTILNEGNLNKLTSALAATQLGTMLTLVPKFLYSAVSSHKIVLPANAKAAVVLRAYSTAGTLTGPLEPVAPGASVTTGLVGTDAMGNILFATADAVTAAQVIYLSHEGEVVEEVVNVSSNVGTLLGSRRGAVLLEATSLAGTLTGALTVTTRAATPTTGLACLNVTGLSVTFAAADAVTLARIKYVVFPPAGLSTAMKTEDKNW